MSASTAAPGGAFAVNAGEIDISTLVEVPVGQIDLTASETISAWVAAANSSRRVLTTAPGGSRLPHEHGRGAINLAPGFRHRRDRLSGFGQPGRRRQHQPPCPLFGGGWP